MSTKGRETWNLGRRGYAALFFDSAGTLYGTATYGGQYGYGVVWEITP